MSRRNRPSTKDVAAFVNKVVPPPDPVLESIEDEEKVQTVTEQQPPTVGWRKSTIPFREDQYRDISKLLAELHTKLDVQLTIAEVVRLGLDKMLRALGNDNERDELLKDLYSQQEYESQGNENLKHSRSRGLREYLAKRSLADERIPQP